MKDGLRRQMRLQGDLCAGAAAVFNEVSCECLVGFSGDQCDQCQGGYFGPACDVCPEGGDEERSRPRITDTCGVKGSGRSRGTCDDTATGSGACECVAPFYGTSCEQGACPAGTVETAESAGVYYAATCDACPPGTYSEENAATCTTCDAGRYSDAGAAACSFASAGSFVASTGASARSPSAYLRTNGARLTARNIAACTRADAAILAAPLNASWAASSSWRGVRSRPASTSLLPAHPPTRARQRSRQLPRGVGFYLPARR